MANHLLSICIPTNGVAKWVIPTIENIYNISKDLDKFEVVVADNGSDSDLEIPIQKFNKYENFRYVKTKAAGFYNIIENFLLARGDYMVKINHRCLLHPGSIDHIISIAEKYYMEKPLIYFSCGHLRKETVDSYSNFDDFLYNLGLQSSCSHGLFFWKEDLDDINSIKFAKMSPNVSLMANSKAKKLFVIDDTVFEHKQNEAGKFGYDIFDTFGVLYLDIINEVRAEGFVSKKTFSKIKKEVLDFLIFNYYLIRYKSGYENFVISNILESLSVYYSKWDYYYLIVKANIYFRIKGLLKRS